MNERQKEVLEKLLGRHPNPLEEDEVKDLLRKHLESRGWQVKVKAARVHGIDVEATNGTERWIIEAKGWAGGSEQQQGNYFLNALGEALQRMEEEHVKYSVAFPDIPRYRGLWERLPALAKRRTGVTCLFVTKEGDVVQSE